jgi:hypothetical protein
LLSGALNEALQESFALGFDFYDVLTPVLIIKEDFHQLPLSEFAAHRRI